MSKPEHEMIYRRSMIGSSVLHTYVCRCGYSVKGRIPERVIRDRDRHLAHPLYSAPSR